MIKTETPDPLAPLRAIAIAQAERRLVKLERLSDMGMVLAEQLAEDANGAIISGELRREPGRAFASVSRAVRLTLALETCIDEHILALHAGEASPFGRHARAYSQLAGTEGKACVDAAPAVPAVPAAPSAQKIRVRDQVWEAIYREVDTLDVAQRTLDRLEAGLIAGAVWDDTLLSPWREAVSAICADLGIAPDWEIWSDDTGFVPETPGKRVVWTKLCKPPPRKTNSS